MKNKYLGEKLVVGIIGAGRIGKLHAENIVTNIRDVELKSIADIYMNNDIEKWAYSMGIKEVSNDYRTIINDGEIDAVLICSPTDTHSRFTIEAAKNGKHVFCEKPIDLDIEKIMNAINVVYNTGVKLQVGFNRRFDHNFKKVKDCVRNGRVGDVHILKITSRDPALPSLDYIKDSGGIFLDMSIHDFDMARYLLENEIVEVYAAGDTFIDKSINQYNDVDTAIIILKFANGAIGIIDNSRQAVYGYDQRIEVFGSGGCIVADNETSDTVKIYDEDWVYSEKPKSFFLERYKESYIDEIKSFVNSIKEDKEPEVTGEDGLISVLIGYAVKKSFEIGKPVKVGEI